MINKNNEVLESPQYIRMSLAAAMTLGFRQGFFYRNAKLYCINLLLTYQSGCAAKCAYCGLSNRRHGVYEKKSFIRVTWPTYALNDIIDRISERQEKVKRICISMIDNRQCIRDIKGICARLRSSFDIPVSLLISPTIVTHNDLLDFKASGADKIGVAIDLATPQLFNQYRGSGVSGPHKWETYWNCLSDAITLFGEGNAGSHFMNGMGETEREMCEAIQKTRDMGGRTHLFSFFPEADSAMADHPQPPMAQYRHVQLARFLIDEQIGREENFIYNDAGQILNYGIPEDKLGAIIDTGEPFRTSGCEGYDGQVACNRPFANSRPGPGMRNFPFPTTEKDVMRIRSQMEDPSRFEKSDVA